jgi:hypothetical protein
MPFIQDLFIKEFIPCLLFRNTRKDKLLLYNTKFYPRMQMYCLRIFEVWAQSLTYLWFIIIIIIIIISIII